MFGKGLRLYKREKLCSVKAIDRLFRIRLAKGHTVNDENGTVGSALVYPLRAVYGTNRSRKGAPMQFLVSVPKKRIRHAVDRVAVRRKVREAFRLTRGDISKIDGSAPPVDIVFVYIADKVTSSKSIHDAVAALLDAIDRHIDKASE